jgi:hypothetical protein
VSDDLVAFLLARLDEDEQTAAAASDGPWTPWRTGGALHGLGDLQHAVTLPGQGPGAKASIVTASWLDAEHIARHDPARVLAEVAAKRAIVKLVFQYEAKIDGEWGCCHDAEEIEAGLCPEIDPSGIQALRLLGAPYAGHEGYRPEWAPDA